MSDKYLEELAREERVENYLNSLSEEQRAIEEKILQTRKSSVEIKADAKAKAREVSDVVKEMMGLTYFEDGKGGEITYQDKIIANAMINSMNNPKLNFADINQLQKVVKDETQDTGVQIVLNTNGMDLGK